MRTLAQWALTSVAVLTLASCGAEEKAATGSPSPSSETIAAALDDGDFVTLERVIDNAGLKAVLEGQGPYTVLAPVEGAFSATPDANFTDASMKAQGAALVRAHVLPGLVTREDIRTALDRSTDQRVQMRTMADGVVTFTRDGEALVVTAEDGASAHLQGNETVGRNGVVQPIDALLVKPAAGTDANSDG